MKGVAHVCAALGAPFRSTPAFLFSKKQAFSKVSGHYRFPVAFPCVAPANSFFIDDIPGLVSPVGRHGFVVRQLPMGNTDVLEDACLQESLYSATRYLVCLVELCG